MIRKIAYIIGLLVFLFSFSGSLESEASKAVNEAAKEAVESQNIESNEDLDSFSLEQKSNDASNSVQENIEEIISIDLDSLKLPLSADESYRNFERNFVENLISLEKTYFDANEVKVEFIDYSQDSYFMVYDDTTDFEQGTKIYEKEIRLNDFVEQSNIEKIKVSLYSPKDEWQATVSTKPKRIEIDENNNCAIEYRTFKYRTFSDLLTLEKSYFEENEVIVEFVDYDSDCYFRIFEYTDCFHQRKKLYVKSINLSDFVLD